MGSGSDFTAFYQHLGIISANLGFTLSYATYGVYHSSMGSMPTRTMPRTWLPHSRLQVLPFDFTTYGFVMAEDLAGLEQQVAALPVDFSKLHQAIDLLTTSATVFHTQLNAFISNEILSANADALHAWNEKLLLLLERHLSTKEGLPHRLCSHLALHDVVLVAVSKQAANLTALFAVLLPFSYWDGFDHDNHLQDLRVDRQSPKMVDDPAPRRSDIYGTFSSAVAVHTPRSGSGALRRATGVAALLFFAVAGYSGVFNDLQTVDVSNALQLGTDAAVGDTAALGLQGVEKAFVDGVNVDNLRAFQHKFSSVPHVAGSQQDYETAVYTAEQFQSFGFRTEIKTYYTLLSTPVRRHLAIVGPTEAARELNLTEPSIAGDSCTSDDDALPPFLAYAATGNVTASVVYVNFGKPEDFEWLVANNVTLRGKIALARYGENYRGLKVMSAEAHGMAGVLIYSDPNEDGFVQGPVYPDGPWRPEDSFQRGATIFLSLAAGDPLTPGFASVPGAPYLDYADAKTIPHIPALPLSYGQAKHILASLGGKKAPTVWQGGISFPHGYRIGDDEATSVNLDIEMDNKIRPIWDVVGTIEGSDEPDRQVILGNHRDAWVCGAIDPSSGSSVLMEIARGLGDLLKQGWRPRRTLVLGSWDGEEPGLLGSTEYAEDNTETLTKQAVAYLNVDSTIGPLVYAASSPSIAAFLFNTAKELPANRFYGNETESTLYDQWVAQTEAKRVQLDGADDGTLGPDHLIKLLGSGSDYSAFYQHLGIISVDMGFAISNHAQYGVYHSSMDSLMYAELYGDPNYSTHASTARWWGLLGLRLADNPVLPFDYTTYATVMAEDLARLEAKVTGVDFAALHEAIGQFRASAGVFHSKLAAFASNDADVIDKEALRSWNEKLVLLERHLISEAGLPHRPWYRHVIFGPGFYEGYAGAAFPGISDCVAFKDNSTTIQTHVDEVANIVNNAADFLLEG